MNIETLLSERLRLSEQSTENSMTNAKASEKIKEQAVQDGLFRMQMNNAMAKIKGMSKLAEAANQL